MKNGCFTNTNGSKYYYKNNLLHRKDGPAIEFANGSKEWYQNGLLHREDGPAVELVNGDKQWLQNGLLHRIDGPAVEYSDNFKCFYYKGNFVGRSEENFKLFIRKMKLKVFW